MSSARSTVDPQPRSDAPGAAPIHGTIRRCFSGLTLAACLLVSSATVVPSAAGSRGPYGLRTEKVWIPMPDGVRLSATLYMPDGGAPGEKFSAVLNYHPYRKDDGSGRSSTDAYFASHGLVGAVVDIRGTGSSEGKAIEHEYSDIEQRDGLEIIDWLSKQPWSTGNVGMRGLSWSGFNSIHMAMRKPPALKAIVPNMASDDLFYDDVHYWDGMVHHSTWEQGFDVSIARSRTPDFPTDEETLAQRFDSPPPTLFYIDKQRDNPYWDGRSLNTDYSAVDIPTMMIGGWYDGYRDSLFRMLEHMDVPVKAIVGPWTHTSPQSASPGPRIEGRHEMVRFFDHWLNGKDTGLMDEPPLSVYVRNWYAPPGTDLEEVPGQWRMEEWPLPRAEPRPLYLTDSGELADVAPSPGHHELEYRPSMGAEFGSRWWGNFTPDQRAVDAAGSLVYESAPLTEDLEILGFPMAMLHASASAPLANWFGRLTDVAPDGSVTLVTGGGLSGARRDPSTEPTALEPGKVYPLELELHVTSWVFPKGHKIRLAISNAFFPLNWPTPYPMTTSLYFGGDRISKLVLPTVPYEARPKPEFLPVQPNPPSENVRYLPGSSSRKVDRDEESGRTRISVRSTSAGDYPWGRRASDQNLIYDIDDDRPEAAELHSDNSITLILEGGSRVLVYRGWMDFEGDHDNFYYRYRRTLLENGIQIREKQWEKTVPRDHH